MTKPVELTEVEASMVLSNWPIGRFADGWLLLGDSLPKRKAMALKETLCKFSSDDSIAACIRVVERRRR